MQLLTQPRVAVAYQLVTDRTNFLLVHERADGEKANDMPQLRKVDQMVPAGWGGTGSVQFSLCSTTFASAVATDQVSGALLLRSGLFKAIPAHGLYKAARTLSSIRSRAVGAFLPGRDQFIDNQDPRYWADSEYYTGLTPLGISEWLRITPKSDWPTTYVQLRQIGLGAWLVDWLELSMAAQGGEPYPESQVVQAFLYLMSRRETHDSLAKSEGLSAVFKAAGQRLRGLLAHESVSIDVSLVEAMAAVLSRMTASVWPEQVFALDCAADQVLMSKHPAVPLDADIR